MAGKGEFPSPATSPCTEPSAAGLAKTPQPKEHRNGHVLLRSILLRIKNTSKAFIWGELQVTPVFKPSPVENPDASLLPMAGPWHRHLCS